ncbi:tRNA lysidine(34) synthetase TilS [Lyticum sinuosum]|uniref:tRNA(Ile)-lysidine synthase n=1 Tax=Lyticum sinuosum TaxID=1332059 RepID=A0AAE5AGP9_9RICK|nr:tRNA lysidine(34) synthetase TilS [Lyticum sinuosum]MDZ5761057.1 tRNA(Ile)-lysidine synthase [Lyticum sinuosum]
MSNNDLIKGFDDKFKNNFFSFLEEIIYELFNRKNHFIRTFFNNFNISSFNIKNEINKITFAIALSGGSDSMCLLSLLHTLSIEYQFKIIPIIINHNLRPESEKEAFFIKDYVKKYFNIETEILLWDNNKSIVKSNIMAKARKARYDLLSEYCSNNNINFLCTAHHLGDQSETIFQRIIFGTGINGLKGILPWMEWNTNDYNNDICNHNNKLHQEEEIINLFKIDNNYEKNDNKNTKNSNQSNNNKKIIVIRPILSWKKSDIIKYLKLKDISWVEDSSNENIRYDRVKVRKYIKDLSDIMSIDNDSLQLKIASLANKAYRISNFLDDIVNNSFIKICHLGINYELEINLNDFYNLHPEVAIKLLFKCFNIMSNSLCNKRLTSETLISLYNNIMYYYAKNKNKYNYYNINNIINIKKAFTLKNCYLFIKKDKIFITREVNSKVSNNKSRSFLPINIPKNIQEEEVIWDNFFKINLIKNSDSIKNIDNNSNFTNISINYTNKLDYDHNYCHTYYIGYLDEKTWSIALPTIKYIFSNLIHKNQNNNKNNSSIYNKLLEDKIESNDRLNIKHEECFKINPDKHLITAIPFLYIKYNEKYNEGNISTNTYKKINIDLSGFQVIPPLYFIGKSISFILNHCISNDEYHNDHKNYKFDNNQIIAIPLFFGETCINILDHNIIIKSSLLQEIIF